MEKLDTFFGEYYKCVENGYDTIVEIVSGVWPVVKNVFFAMIFFPLWLIGKVSKKQD